MSHGPDSGVPVIQTERAPAALAALAGDYEIVRELGRGGTAVVYLARERASGDEVAIKLIRAQFADDGEASARLAREARFVAQLDHPNIVPVRAVLDLGDAGLALVMEHAEGRTLKAVLREDGALSPAAAERVVRDLALALGAAHDLGIVHRDVKPENVFVDESGHAQLADFGIARSMSADAQQLTMSGVAIGTPAYMAPEQIDGVELDGRADIYSLGLVGWEMLAGRRPWAGEALYSVLYHQKHVQLADPRELRPDLSEALVGAIAGAVEKERTLRWENAAGLIEALDGAGDPRPWPAVAPLATGTIRVDRDALPEESVVAIDWRKLAGTPEAVTALGPRRYSRRRVAAGGGIAAIVMLALAVGAVRSRAGEEASARHAAEAPTLQARQPATDSAPPRQTVNAGEVADTMALSAAADSAITIVMAPSAPASPVASTAAPNEPTPSRATARVRIAAGGTHSCLLVEDGRAFCWGGNDRGQLGTNGTTRLGTPAAEAGTMRFTAIASGMSHSCAIARDAAAWCWGDNDSGQLGDGTTTGRLAPARVAGSRRYLSITAGSAHSCALASDGSAWCWGSNENGQLGDGTASDRVAPVRVAGRHRFTHIAAGWNFTCALDAGGRAWCWGENGSGQLGDSSTVARHQPVRVRGATSFTAIAAGSAHTCAVAAGGTAYCWGSNSSGQIGDGSLEDRRSPVRVRGDSRFVSIAAGAVHSCALTDAGDAMCWGLNTYGQLGDDSNSDRLRPVPVAGAHRFASVRAFGSHSCGVTVSGETFCWGYNLEGQLGDGTRTHRARPVYVERPGG